MPHFQDFNIEGKQLCVKQPFHPSVAFFSLLNGFMGYVLIAMIIQCIQYETQEFPSVHLSSVTLRGHPPPLDSESGLTGGLISLNRQTKRIVFIPYILFRFANVIVLFCLDEKKYRFVDNFQIFSNTFFSNFFRFLKFQNSGGGIHTLSFILPCKSEC